MTRTLLALLLYASPLVAQELSIGGSITPLTGGDTPVRLEPAIGVGLGVDVGRVRIGAAWTPSHWRQGSESWRVHWVRGHALVHATGGELYGEAGPSVTCWSGFDPGAWGDGPVCKPAAAVGLGARVWRLEVGVRATGWRESMKALRDRGCAPTRCDVHLAVALEARVSWVRGQ